MSAYAALVSLQRIMGTIFDGGLWNFHNKTQLHSIHEKVIFLLHFLDNSSTYKTTQMSAVETRIREAAYKADDLIESQISRILNSNSRRLRVLIIMTLINFMYSFFILNTSNRFHASFPEVIFDWIEISLIPIFIHALGAIAISTTLTVVWNLALQASNFPENYGSRAHETKDLLVVCCDLIFISVEVSLKVVRGDLEMSSAHAALLSLRALAAIANSTILAVVLNLALQATNFSLHCVSRGQETQDLDVVLYDLNFIVEEVMRIKEARGDLKMSSAHAALLSLRKIIDSILESGGLRVYHNGQLKSLHEKASFLLDFLGNNSAYMAAQKPALQNLEATIGDAVYKAQEVIIYRIPAQFVRDSDRRSLRGFEKIIVPLLINASVILFIAPFLIQVNWVIAVATSFLGTVTLGLIRRIKVWIDISDSERQENQELCLIIDVLSVIVKKVKMIKDACANRRTLPSAAASSSSRRDLGGTSKNVVVGLEKDMEQMRARFIQHSSKLEVISIVGMGGIGKTTLANQVFKDRHIIDHFDIRAWVTISQDYSLRHVLLGLLDSAMLLTEEKREDNYDKLALYLHQCLMYRRFLIVIDDAWDTEIWDLLSIYFPENCNGSRVLLTTRLTDVVSYPDSGSPLHQMQCLNDNESWHLLREKVFGEEDCPSELESIGREIARSCGGLPLAILVIGGLLYKDKRSEIWREVRENLKLKLRQVEEQCLEILGLSYDHLPHHLRPCFLYMGVFLGDSEIPVSRLVNLWAAEGFVKPCTSKSLEEVAEDYLKDLIHRNLVLVCKRSCNGKIRTCSIHDLLRDVCVENARKENFFLVMECGEKPEQTPRRLSVRPDAPQINARHGWISSYDYVCSFLCTASKLLHNQSGLYLGFLNLRVLDVLVVHFGEFPHQIIKLLHLRYLAFHCDGPLPPSMSKLHNLETIVYHHCLFSEYPLLPKVIWSMPNLRHLYVKPGCYLSDPLGYRLLWKIFVLEHLQTLAGITNFKWTKAIIKRIPNLKKLGISYDVSSSVDWSKYQLESLVDLHQLETLKIIIKYNDVGSAISHDPPKLAFPRKLKKLTLSGCRIPWTSIGALPNLEALKLRCEACSGPSWETVEEQFPQLIFLLLEQIRFMWWETDAEHFPLLQRLVIRSRGMLQEIPSAIGDIPTLEVIELVDCNDSVVDSAEQIQTEQESMGNVDLKVCIGLSSHIP